MRERQEGPETRIKLQTSFQDSYLQDSKIKNYTSQRSSTSLKHQLMEAQAELDLLRATHQFLLRQLIGKPKQPKKDLIPTSAEYLEKAIAYSESAVKLQNFLKEQ